eukprot:SAG11_NODE_461_length_9234_cov_10.929611_3_plen_204_part_00
MPTLVVSALQFKLTNDSNAGCDDRLPAPQCRITDQNLCPDVHTEEVERLTYPSGDPKPDIFPLGWDGVARHDARGSVVTLHEQPHNRACTGLEPCPEEACHPAAACIPTLGGHMCQCPQFSAANGTDRRNRETVLPPMVRGTCHESSSCAKQSSAAGASWSCICGPPELENGRVVARTYELLSAAQVCESLASAATLHCCLVC